MSNTLINKENILSDYAADFGPYGDCVIRVIDRLGINVTLNNTLDGRQVRLMVREDDLIRDVKKKIRNRIRFNKDEHRLSFKGRILKDDKCIRYYDIGRDSVIDVVPSSMVILIYALRMGGDTVAFEVAKTDTIIDIKKKFQEKIGLSPDDQKLMYQGRILKDDKSINEYNINENDIINVVARIRGEMQIFAKTMDGTTVALHMSTFDTIITLKEKIYDRIGLWPGDHKLVYEGEILKDDKSINDYDISENDVINVRNVPSWIFKIFAKPIDGKIVTLYVSKFDRFRDIKWKIQEKIGISPDEQKLMYQGGILEDDKTVDDYDIGEKSVIHVMNRPSGILKIFARTMDGKIVALHMSEFDTIVYLKEKIREKIKISPRDQKLSYQGGILEDDKTINYYDIEDRSIIDLVYQLKGSGHKCVRVMIGDDGDILDVEGLHMISDVKMTLQDKTGLSPEEQQLTYQVRLLEDDDSIMKYDDPIIITLLDIPRLMFARTKQGKTIVLQVKLMDRIIDIKKMIQAKTGLPPYKQILRLSETELIDDNMKVYEHKIATKSNIDVTEVSRSMVAILSDNMETIMIEINNGDKVIDVKKRLEVKLGLPCDDQILKFQEDIMNDDDDIMDSYIVRGLRDITISGSSPPKTRGVCVVISNKTFSQGYGDRLGTEVDEDNIKNTFQPMGYGIEVHQNVSSSSMQSIIDETKKKINEKHRNMIVFVLSHGQENGVVMSDETIVPFKNIWTPFSNEKFPKFAGKSKLFFFACCLGSNLNNAVPGANNSPVQYDGPPSNTGQVPAMGDFFLGYATCESYLACRYPSSGTIYIECLCKVVRDYPLWSISDIHQEVQTILYKKIIQGTHFQMPHCDSMLGCHAYFYGYNQ